MLTGIVISQGLAALKINSFFRLLSCLRAAAESEKRGDFCLAHAIEVSGHFDLTFEEAEPLRFCRRIERRDLDERLAGLGDDE